MQNYLIDLDRMRQAEGVIWPALSGQLTGVAAGADLVAFRNPSTTRKFVAVAIESRWVTRTAFPAAQSIAVRIHKVSAFTTLHNAGGSALVVSAKHTLSAGAVGLSGYVADVSAIYGGVYTVDPGAPVAFAVGAGSTLPGLYDSTQLCSRDGLPVVLGVNAGFVCQLHTPLVGAGVGNLYLALHGHWQRDQR